MPIVGLTDRVMPSFPRIGKLRKGGEKKGNRPGPELDHWRFTSAQPEVEAAFHAAYGEEPHVVNVFLPYGKLEENWLTWKEKWAAGGLVHRCDGQTMRLWRDERGKYRQEPKPCPYADKPKDKDACKEVGRLIVVVPELWEAGHVGFVTMETHSLNDIMDIQASLLRMLEESPAGLRGVPFLLRRVPAMISTPGEGSKRVRREKWLVALEPAARWSRLQLKAAEAAAMGNERALPAPKHGVTIDSVTGEVIDDDVPWEDAPEAEAEPETDADFDWVNDSAKKKAFAAKLKALGVKDPSWITVALGVDKVSAFEGTMTDALEVIGTYVKLRKYAASVGVNGEEMLTAMSVNGYADFEHSEDVAKDLIDEYAEWKAEQPEQPETESEAA